MTARGLFDLARDSTICNLGSDYKIGVVKIVSSVRYSRIICVAVPMLGQAPKERHAPNRA